MSKDVEVYASLPIKRNDSPNRTPVVNRFRPGFYFCREPTLGELSVQLIVERILNYI